MLLMGIIPIVEPITPPEGAKVGECVSFSGYVRENLALERLYRVNFARHLRNTGEIYI